MAESEFNTGSGFDIILEACRLVVGDRAGNKKQITPKVEGLTPAPCSRP